MAKKFSHVYDGQANSIDEIVGAARDAICRSRHSVFLSRFAAIDLAHWGLRLYTSRSFSNVVQDNSGKRHHGRDQSDGLEPIFPERERDRDAGILRQSAILFWVARIMQNVDNRRPANRLR